MAHARQACNIEAVAIFRNVAVFALSSIVAAMHCYIAERPERSSDRDQKKQIAPKSIYQLNKRNAVFDVGVARKCYECR